MGYERHIFYAYNDSDRRLRKAAEKICHNEGKFRGYQDYFDWCKNEFDKAREFMLGVLRTIKK